MLRSKGGIAVALTGGTVAVAALATVPGEGSSGLGMSSAKAQGTPCEPQVVDVFDDPTGADLQEITVRGIDPTTGQPIPPGPEADDATGGLDGVVGDERDMALERTNPLEDPPGASAQLNVSPPPGGNGFLTWSNDTGVISTGSITWDGSDGDATSLDPTGLGGRDYFSGEGAAGVFSFEVTAWDLVDDQDAVYTLEVYTSAGAASTQTVPVDGPVPEGTIVEFPISGFTPLAGAGADFSDVGAIVFSFASTDQDLDTAYDNLMAPCRSGPPARPRPKLRKSASKKRLVAGRTVRWRLAARNRGNAPARGVRVCDPVHGRVTLVEINGARLDDGKLCWRFRALGPGRTKRRSFKVRVDRDAPDGRIRNRARLRWEGQRRRASASIRVTSVDDEETSPVTG